MEPQKTDSIIDRVKNILGISEHSLALPDVYERLCKALVNNHPDLYTDRDAKKKAEERFKVLNALREELKTFMEQQTAKGDLVIYGEKTDLATIQNLTKKAELEVQLSQLTHDNNCLKRDLELARAQTNNIKEELHKVQTQYSKTSEEKLKNIYKPKKIGNVVGISAAIVSLASFVPAAQNVVDNLGVCGFLGKVLVLLLTCVWFLRWIRNFIGVMFIHSVIDKTLMGTDLMQQLHVAIPQNQYEYPCFSEQSLIELVDSYMNKSYLKVIFFGSYNAIRRQIVEHIILELECKNVIVKTKNNDMQRYFYVEHSSSDSSMPF